MLKYHNKDDKELAAKYHSLFSKILYKYILILYKVL